MRGVDELAPEAGPPNDGSNWSRTSFTIPWMSAMEVLAGGSVLVPGGSASVGLRGEAIIERRNN